MRVHFGECTFDTSARELTRDGAPVALTPKAFTLLETLVEQHPAAVSKEALYTRLWPGVFVEEGNLHTLVSEVRDAIGDDAHAIVVTKHRFGYAIADMRAEKRANIHLIAGATTIPLREGETIVGRDAIGTPDVSRRHARIVVHGDRVTIEDLDSKNGTWINGRKITTHTLTNGDEILLGHTRVRIVFAEDSTITARPDLSGSSSPERDR